MKRQCSCCPESSEIVTCLECGKKYDREEQVGAPFPVCNVCEPSRPRYCTPCILKMVDDGVENFLTYHQKHVHSSIEVT